jgi:hypothetical protein
MQEVPLGSLCSGAEVPGAAPAPPRNSPGGKGPTTITRSQQAVVCIRE